MAKISPIGVALFGTVPRLNRSYRAVAVSRLADRREILAYSFLRSLISNNMSLLCSSEDFFFFSIDEISFNLTLLSPLPRFSVLKGVALSVKIAEREYVSFLMVGVAGTFMVRISPLKLPG